MNKHLKKFLHRGLIFSGFGPIVLGIVLAILSVSIDNFSLSGGEVLSGIISTYILAFVHAGSSVFNEIEGWSLSRSLLCQLGSLYLAYTFFYLINSWIPFEPIVILIYTVIFVTAYLAIWLTVYLLTKGISRRLNARLGK